MAARRLTADQVRYRLPCRRRPKVRADKARLSAGAIARKVPGQLAGALSAAQIRDVGAHGRRVPVGMEGGTRIGVLKASRANLRFLAFVKRARISIVEKIWGQTITDSLRFIRSLTV